MRALMVVPFLFACAPALAQQPTMQPGSQIDPPQIATSAIGESRVRPDRATIMVGVQTRAASAAAAADENARRTEAVLAALRRLGLAAEQLSTLDYSVYPEVRHDREGQNPQVTGYTVQNTIRAEVRQIEQVGRLIDTALGAGANTIHSLTFQASTIAEARREALASAMAKARADAEVLARAAGGSLGRLLEAATTEMGFPIPIRGMARMDVAQAAPTPIEPGQQQVSAQVTARWEFVPGR